MSIKNRWSRWFGQGQKQNQGQDQNQDHDQSQAESIRPEDYVGDDADRNQQLVRERFVAKAKRHLSALPMADEVVAAYFCMLDPQTPKWVKGVAAASLAYFIMPFDAVFDAIPFAGLMDDAGVLATALTTISAFITDQHRQQARDWLTREQIVTVEIDPDAPSGATKSSQP